MPSWKKVIVSGSNVALAEITASGEIKTPSILSTHITASGNVKGAGSASFATYTGIGGETTIGSTLTGLNKTSAGTSIVSALDSIDGILAKLAPAKPALLGSAALKLDLSSTSGTEFWGHSATTLAPTGSSGNKNVTISAIQKLQAGGTDTSDSNFFDGDTTLNTCKLSASVQEASGSWSVLGNKELIDGVTNGGSHVGDDENSNTKLYISVDTAAPDPAAEFWRVLRAYCQTNFAASVTTTPRVRLELEVNGDSSGNVQEASYWVVSDSILTTSEGNVQFDDAVNAPGTTTWKYSGISYFGRGSTISSSYKLTTPSDFQFINSTKTLGSTNTGYTTALVTYKAVAAGTGLEGVSKAVPINPDTTMKVTSSLSISGDKYHHSTVSFYHKGHEATKTTFSNSSTNNTYSLLIDTIASDWTSITDNNEITPYAGSTRVKSGTSKWPLKSSGGNSAFGWSYNSSGLLGSSAYRVELQYSNAVYHWPHNINYTATTTFPTNTGDYTEAQVQNNGDASNNETRYATFALTDVPSTTSIQFKIWGCSGWEDDLVQIADDFHFYAKIMVGNTEKTCWINCNKVWNSHGSDFCAPGNDHGDTNTFGALTSADSSTPGTSGDFVRNITLGNTYSGTVYVRIGWTVDGGAGNDASNRQFKYITIL